MALVAALTVVPATPAAAEPEQSLDELVDRSDELGEEYRGDLRDMEGVLETAEQAAERAEKTQEKVDDARGEVRQLAIASYQQGGLEPALTLFVEDDPQDIIDRSVLVNHLAHNNEAQINQLQEAIERDKKAEKSAKEKVDKAKADLEELEGRREEVQALIADYPVQEMGPPDSLTPRTRQMRDIISEKFGEEPAVGCYRPDGGWVVGEHPKGRACDFMMTTEGVMPPENQIQRGYNIAEWAQDNAKRLGIMYIIYRQKIWDIRRGDEGWRQMENRGSITENHFDHVHISMF